MAVIETWFHQDLQEPVKVNYLDGNLFSNNGNGNRIGVVLTNNGEDLASISGTVSGYVVTADGSTVPCTGSKSGNRASILIPAAAYQPGSIFITVFVTDRTTVTTIGAVCTTVMRSRTNAQVDPGTAVTDWTQTINAAMQSVETAAANLGGIVAVPYASITFPVPLGKYTYYNNNLYRCITPIASSESFTAAHWTQVRLGDDVSDLKSELNGIREHTKNLFDPSNVLNAYFTTGNIKANDATRMVWIPCDPSTTYTVSKTAGTRFAVAYTTSIPDIGVTSQSVETNYNGSSITYTTGVDAQYLVAWVYNGGSDSGTAEAMLASVQIELSSSATSYEPPYSAIDRIIRSKAFTSLGILDAGTDLNSVRSYKGYYLLSYSGSYDNDPVGTNKRRYLMCFPFNETPGLLQVIFNATDGIIYQRFFVSNTWGGWKSTKVDTFENYGTLPNGTDLDTLYGIDGFYTMSVSSVYGHDPVGPLNRRLLTCYKKATFTHQILFNSTTGDIYQRVFASNSWSEWKRNADQTQEICGSYTDRICTSHAGVFSNSKYQNSPKAFKDARKLGIMYQELDVVFTKDLVPIVSHSSFADNAMDASTTPPTPITSEFRFKNYTLEQLKENYVFGDADYYWTIMTLSEAYALLQDLGCRIIVDVGGGHNNPTGSRELLCSYMIENGIQCEGLITSECTGDYEHDTFGILCETGGEKFPLGVVVAASTSDDLTTAVAKINAIISAKSDLNLEKAWCFVRRERMASGGDLLSYVETLRNAGVKIAGYSYDASTYSIDIPTFFSLVISGSVNINYLRYLDAMNS